MNTTKTESIVFLPRRIRTCLSEEAYCSMMDPSVGGPKEGQQVRCELCQKGFAASYLATHLEVQHNVQHAYALEKVCHPAVVVELWVPAPAGHGQV